MTRQTKKKQQTKQFKLEAFFCVTGQATGHSFKHNLCQPGIAQEEDKIIKSVFQLAPCQKFLGKLKHNKNKSDLSIINRLAINFYHSSTIFIESNKYMSTNIKPFLPQITFCEKIYLE